VEIRHTETAGPDHRRYAIGYGQPSSVWDKLVMKVERKLTRVLKTEEQVGGRKATQMSLEPRADRHGLYLRLAARRERRPDADRQRVMVPAGLTDTLA
jgi:hypothetical protein